MHFFFTSLSDLKIKTSFSGGFSSSLFGTTPCTQALIEIEKLIKTRVLKQRKIKFIDSPAGTVLNSLEIITVFLFFSKSGVLFFEHFSPPEIFRTVVNIRNSYYNEFEQKKGEL